jgi:hypothetical protein
MIRASNPYKRLSLVVPLLKEKGLIIYSSRTSVERELTRLANCSLTIIPSRLVTIFNDTRMYKLEMMNG